jgi:hypothetical protein
VELGLAKGEADATRTERCATSCLATIRATIFIAGTVCDANRPAMPFAVGFRVTQIIDDAHCPGRIARLPGALLRPSWPRSEPPGKNSRKLL